MTRIPFSEPREQDEWVYTSAGRISCESCGEWIYPRRRVTGRAFALPPSCAICGAALAGNQP